VHLVPAKVPLPKEAILNRNMAAAERRRAARKAQHKEWEIAKRDRNDNRIKRLKAGERDVSSNEDPSPEPTWSSDEPSAVINDISMLCVQLLRLYAISMLCVQLLSSCFILALYLI
jgi:hypothetical protein